MRFYLIIIYNIILITILFIGAEQINKITNDFQQGITK